MNKKIFFLTAALPLVWAAARGQAVVQEHRLLTRWAAQVGPSNTLPEYPRPQMVRDNWQNLNGEWQYAIVPKDAGIPAAMDGTILVPFPLESALSGVKKSLRPNQHLWYRRSFDHRPGGRGERVLLHFGAVDYQALVMVNGRQAGSHEGGYTAFGFDITDLLREGENELTVRVYDPTNQGVGPHGKQVLDPANIYYTPSSGIWQTVWLERVPTRHIERLEMTPDIDRSMLKIKVISRSDAPVEITAAGKTIRGRSNRVLELPVPRARLWSPADPYLYELKATLGDDRVESYFGMRKISVGKDAGGFDRIMLNGEPYFNLGTLDQGFWPDGLYTAPTDEALAFDIRLIKAMGFNTIRKHIKAEPARWYYWADKLGILVWQDMVNPNQRLPEGSKAAFERQSKEIIGQLRNHPCITTWVLFNEKWGAYDQERLTRWIRQTDPSRLVNGHSGEYLYVNGVLRSPSPNAYVAADMTDVHAYPDPMNSLRQEGKAQALGEFGGIGVFIPGHQWNTGAAWGYINEKPASLAVKYRLMNQHLQLLQRDGLSASIYTQPFDVEGEQNGLATYDREVVKIPLDQLRNIHAPLNPAIGTLPEVTIADADLADPMVSYSDLLQKYLDGERDPGFLQKLSVMAAQAGDKTVSGLVSNEYIATMKEPYTRQQFDYIMQVTTSTADRGFDIISRNIRAINGEQGGRIAQTKLMNVIYADLIAPSIEGGNPQPDWDALATTVAPYGQTGEEILLRARTIHCLNAGRWRDFAQAADQYVTGYGKYISPAELNSFAWAVFEHIFDPALLLKAAGWSELSLKDAEEPQFLDTRANLLYKAGKKQEAVVIQQRAVELSGDPAMKTTLETMKKGLANP